MKRFFPIFIVLFLIPIETLILERLRIYGIKPDLSLVWVYLFGWVRGEVQGMVWGMALGGLLDVFSAGVLGVNFFLKTAIGLLSGILGKIFFNLVSWGLALTLFPVSLAHDFFGGLFLHSQAWVNTSIAREMMIRGGYNSALALLFLLLSGFHKTRKRVEYEGVGFSPK